jgi:hypothetical protein
MKNFTEYYYQNESFSDMIGSVKNIFANDGYPKNVQLWKSIEKEASRLYGKKDSIIKRNWMKSQYKNKGGMFTNIQMAY